MKQPAQTSVIVTQEMRVGKPSFQAHCFSPLYHIGLYKYIQINPRLLGLPVGSPGQPGIQFIIPFSSPVLNQTALEPIMM
jgi:hypothetical protein